MESGEEPPTDQQHTDRKQLREVNGRPSSSELPRTLTAKTAEEADLFKEPARLETVMGLPGNFKKLTPSRRTHNLSLTDNKDPNMISDVKLSGKLTVLRAAQGSLHPVASVIRSYLNFGALTDQQPFPPVGRTVAQRIAIPNP